MKRYWAEKDSSIQSINLTLVGRRFLTISVVLNHGRFVMEIYPSRRILDYQKMSY